MQLQFITTHKNIHQNCILFSTLCVYALLGVFFRALELSKHECILK